MLSASFPFYLPNHVIVVGRWDNLGPAHPEHNMTVVLGLKQQNLAALEKMFNAVSDPTHQSYGRHMRKEQVGDGKVE